ncbi:hypothetical protein [Amycolatopsis rubida]|uniref:Uncharacterized protein n=1 Tax=Amycolatopsis rubida TaxID=112413 RepID=A0A1I5E5S8_9PSEU|nr:hypothetical protein [Amycolatopsis rubida]SFO06915.1 hypothetical protein SAMN05421854_101514 [Amycolatopsis rubida]
MRFLDRNGGETKAKLKAALHQLARDQREQLIVTAPDGAPVACYALVEAERNLQVPLLRLADHAIAPTLGRQLLWHLREQARTRGCSVVDITDPHLPPHLQNIARREHYQHVGDHWYAVVVDQIGTGAEISAATTQAYRQAGLAAAPLIPARIDADTAHHYERVWWPAKIIDSELPHFAVLIRPVWSSELFGVPAPLLKRRADLAFGREQVYFRSGRNSTLTTPSRILWYMSSSRRDGPAAIIGTSLLDGITTGTPDELFTAYGHYGVYHLANIYDAARDGRAQVLQLSDTELFPKPVDRKNYDRLLRIHKGPQSIQSPVNVSPELFTAIYRLGQG